VVRPIAGEYGMTMDDTA